MSTNPKSGRFKRLFSLVLLFCSLLLVYRLLYKAWIGSTDFHVYWKAAQDWISSSQSPYYFDASTKGFVFKYPPWSLLIFAPFGMMGFDAAKMVWALVELFCLLYSVYKIIFFGVRKEIAFLVAVTLWWIWQDHFWSGQLTIILLATALWITDDLSRDAQTTSWSKLSLTAYFFTAKIFSVFTFLGNWKKFLDPKVTGGTAFLCIGPTLITWWVMRFQDPNLSLIGVFQQFAAAAKSGGAELGEHVVRGQLNHGFTAAVLRSFHVDSTQSIYDSVVCIGLTAFFGLLWNRFRSELTEREYFFGWLALALITHPLAWDHSFILAYPLCAASLERAVQTRTRKLIALSFLGCACIGLLIPNVIGTEAVKPFEYIAIKSWGVVFSAIALVLSQRALARKFTS